MTLCIQSVSFQSMTKTAITLMALTCLVSATSCDASPDGPGGSNSGDGAGDGGAQTGDGDGDGDGGDGIDLGGGGGPAGPVCDDPMCVGATLQGECDAGLQIGAMDALDAARAIGLCQVASETSWGVVAATYVRADGQPLGPGLDIGHGLLSSFGAQVQPREGERMLVLSTGTARTPSDPGYQSVQGAWKDFDSHGAPAGYPKESPSCPGVTTGAPFDSSGLELTVRTPTDAKSLSYNLNFYTSEFPQFICTEFNDFFVAMLSPTLAGQTDGNISFDTLGNTISVNAGFLQVCTPQQAGGKPYDCPAGPGALAGTGFDEQPNGGSAATDWLVTTAPIEAPGSDITLRFATWDSTDGVLDSTVLIDNFRFELVEAPTETVPAPK